MELGCLVWQKYNDCQQEPQGSSMVIKLALQASDAGMEVQ